MNVLRLVFLGHRRLLFAGEGFRPVKSYYMETQGQERWSYVR